MKKFLIILALALFAPALALAQTSDTGEACTAYTCKCSWPTLYSITGSPIMTSGVQTIDVVAQPYDLTMADKKVDSHAECKQVCVFEAGLEPQQETWVSGSAICAFTPVATEVNEPIFPQLNIVLPGLGYMIKDGKPFWSEAEITTVNGVQNTNLLGTYVKALYGYLLGAASIIAVTMLMISGLQYATARGDAKQVSQAKARIGNAVVGVILLLLAYNIAFLINPKTTTFDSLGILNVQGIEIDDETPVNFEEDFEPTNEEGPISVPLLDQKQYAGTPYGPDRCLTASSGNIKSSGCGVVSFTMVANALGCTDEITPPYVAEVFYNEGQEPSYRPLDSQGCGYNGTYNSAMYENPLIEACNLKARQIPISDTAQLKELVAEGKLIITSYRTASGGGHYVVISGYTDDGRLIVSNPWGGTREARSEAWWFSTIKSAAYVDTEADFIP